MLSGIEDVAEVVGQMLGITARIGLALASMASLRIGHAYVMVKKQVDAFVIAQKVSIKFKIYACIISKHKNTM